MKLHLLLCSGLCYLPSLHAAYVVQEVYLGTAVTTVAGEIPVDVFSQQDVVANFIPELNFDDNALAQQFTVSSALMEGVTLQVYEGRFDSVAHEGRLPASLVALPSGDPIAYEASVAGGGDGVGQDAAHSLAFGFDTLATNHSDNGALVFSFLASTARVHQFGLDLLDYEGGSTIPAYVGIYDLTGHLSLAKSLRFDADPVGVSSNGFGDGVVRFFAIEGDVSTPIGAVVFVVGDDNDFADGRTERLAAGDFYIGSRGVPVPASLPLLLSALGLLAGSKILFANTNNSHYHAEHACSRA